MLALPRSADGDRAVSVQVWGEGALFTRPEFRVERMSYPVMTPTAAIGILESIFWKPEFEWVPIAIEVLRPIRQFSLRRNETHDLPSFADAVGRGRRVDTVANREQRAAMCLRDVAYRIHAHVELRPHATKNTTAYRDQFRRRVDRGACFQQPYLGTREFPASFAHIDETPRINVSEDLGMMLHRIIPGPPMDSTYFRARLEGGVLSIPRHGIRGDEQAGAA
ncbi:CRISPR-associated protein, Cas5d family [Frankia sp. EI5c]|uniref:type I-C CRISPR-associated protein Cas5c n=1 Tax=Frankia sp. EI5c TaxID=683316 RepID=UPI0007C25E06|nr:type I-C CRISPR-associated protein Cas5c [Frankia sp. EI5c]OAA19958.1 CRISPR-associated protein, Cas5d family [Frankia sp. EI5c]